MLPPPPPPSSSREARGRAAARLAAADQRGSRGRKRGPKRPGRGRVQGCIVGAIAADDFLVVVGALLLSVLPSPATDPERFAFPVPHRRRSWTPPPPPGCSVRSGGSCAPGRLIRRALLGCSKAPRKERRRSSSLVGKKNRRDQEEISEKMNSAKKRGGGELGELHAEGARAPPRPPFPSLRSPFPLLKAGSREHSPNAKKKKRERRNFKSESVKSEKV